MRHTEAPFEAFQRIPKSHRVFVSFSISQSLLSSASWSTTRNCGNHFNKNISVEIVICHKCSSIPCNGSSSSSLQPILSCVFCCRIIFFSNKIIVVLLSVKITLKDKYYFSPWMHQALKEKKKTINISFFSAHRWIDWLMNRWFKALFHKFLEYWEIENILRDIAHILALVFDQNRWKKNVYSIFAHSLNER